MRLLWMKLLQNTTQKKDAGKYKVLEDSVAKKNMSLDSEKMTKHFATKL